MGQHCSRGKTIHPLGSSEENPNATAIGQVGDERRRSQGQHTGFPLCTSQCKAKVLLVGTESTGEVGTRETKDLARCKK